MKNDGATSSSNIRVSTGVAVALAMCGSALSAPSVASAATTCPTGSTEVAGQSYCDVVFTAAGAHQWTVPANVTQLDILTVGAGGGGGGASNGYAAGGGGGAGRVEVFTNQTVTPGEAVAVNVGAGGVAGTTGASANGGGGGSSSLTDAARSFVAKGGLGGFGGETVGNNADTMQDGGSSGNGNAGGSGVPSPAVATWNGIIWPLAGGGAGAGAPGQSAADANNDGALSPVDFVTLMLTPNTPLVSGAGGIGVTPTDGLFSNETTTFGIGGGGGAVTLTSDSTQHEWNNAPGHETGGATGAWGSAQGDIPVNATTPAANSGNGGGGGAGISFSYQTTIANASAGADGYVEIRFMPYVAPVTTKVPHVMAHPHANVYFGLDMTNLSPSAVTMLHRFVREVRLDKVTHLTIEGFADAQGQRAHNLALSNTRAVVVAQYLRHALAKAGISNVHFTVSGKGVSTANQFFALNRVVTITSK